jgi:hypothetical protein
MAHAGHPVPASYRALRGASSKLSLCPSDFHFFASFFVVGRPLLATDLCRSPAVEITLLLNSRSRNLSQTPFSCVREIESDRPEVIVTPVSAVDRQVETVSKFGEKTESCRYLDSRVFRFPHPPTPHPPPLSPSERVLHVAVAQFPVHLGEQTNRNPGLVLLFMVAR